MTRSAVRLDATTWGNGAFAIVHRSTTPADKAWRVSFFDDAGAVGHTCRDTAEECLRVAVSDGYRNHDEDAT